MQGIERLAQRHSTWQVFSDFVEVSAIAMSNAVDRGQRETREARYLEVVKRYTTKEVEQFPQLFAELTQALDARPEDVLGQVFHDLELHHKYAGQFFTPTHLCRMMAQVTLGEPRELYTRMVERGFLTAQEPACGGGAMVIALAGELLAAEINYQKALHVTATDVDLKCVHMAYVQFALLGIPAVVVHGNSISLEEWSRWYTPHHTLHGWSRKLAQNRATDVAATTPEEHRSEEPPPPPTAGPGTQLTLFARHHAATPAPTRMGTSTTTRNKETRAIWSSSPKTSPRNDRGAIPNGRSTGEQRQCRPLRYRVEGSASARPPG